MLKFVIDPGHYGNYEHGICSNYNEGSAMLRLSKLLGELLSSNSTEVIYTRINNDENPSLEKRGNMAKNADLFISLHSNTSDNPLLRGTTVYHSVQQPITQCLATDIGNAVAKTMGTNFIEAATKAYPNEPNLDYYGVIRASVAVNAKNSILVEHGFHSNAKDCTILSNPKNLKNIARAEATVILGYFSGDKPSNCCTFRYTVQKNDSLYKIGIRFGIAWETIAHINNISYPYRIYAGQIIFLPMCRA